MQKPPEMGGFFLVAGIGLICSNQLCLLSESSLRDSAKDGVLSSRACADFDYHEHLLVRDQDGGWEGGGCAGEVTDLRSQTVVDDFHVKYYN